jgi:hypothetical protein
MKPYVVKQGDYLDKIAHAVGCEPDEIWSDSKNSEIKQKRDPNLLAPGDILYVPDSKKQWLSLKMGTSNVYIAKVPRTKVRLVFKELLNEPYEIHGMGEPEEGSTDGDGGLEMSVPVHVREVQVTFPKSQITYPVRIGDMDPIDEPSGIRKRLQHLGYGTRLGDGASADDLEVADRLAILAFQQDQGLEATGSMNDDTLAALTKTHDR